MSEVTPMTIVNQPYKFGWRGNDLYLEVHIPRENATVARSVMPESVASAAEVNLDWNAVKRAVTENTGIPQLVGGRQSAAERLYLDMIF